MVSAVTTILFVLGTGCVVAIGSRKVRRFSACIATSAFIINIQWILRIGRPGRFNLSVDYFLSWASFLLLAIGLFRESDVKEISST